MANETNFDCNERQNFPEHLNIAFNGLDTQPSILDFCVRMHLYQNEYIVYGVLDLRPPEIPLPQKIIRFSSLSNKWKFRIGNTTQYTTPLTIWAHLLQVAIKSLGFKRCVCTTPMWVCVCAVCGVCLCIQNRTKNKHCEREKREGAWMRWNTLEHTGTRETELLLSKRNCV